jgi:hypothetical protein
LNCYRRLEKAFRKHCSTALGGLCSVGLHYTRWGFKQLSLVPYTVQCASKHFSLLLPQGRRWFLKIYIWHLCFNKCELCQAQWFKAITLATGEREMRMIVVKGQPEQNVCKTCISVSGWTMCHMPVISAIWWSMNRRITAQAPLSHKMRPNLKMTNAKRAWTIT